MAFVTFAFFFFRNSPLPRIPPFFSNKPSFLFLNSFPLSDLDETFYIDSFWNGICVVCIFFEIPRLHSQKGGKSMMEIDFTFKKKKYGFYKIVLQPFLGVLEHSFDFLGLLIWQNF